VVCARLVTVSPRTQGEIEAKAIWITEGIRQPLHAGENLWRMIAD
jgi:hypothetical protein